MPRDMQDPERDDMLALLKETYGVDAEPFDVEAAIYWFANDWHGGQWSNLYSALSTSPYRPGACENGPDPESPAADMYATLEEHYSR